MKESYTSKKRVRKNFGKIDAVIDMPSLIEVQTGSYNSFIKNVDAQGNHCEFGLEEVFKSIFPIKDFDFAMENDKKPIIILQRLENITYQNFKDNEYTKECLKNYFIKSDEECPITDIIIQKEKNNTPVGYHEKIFKNIYFYYTNNKLDG